MKITEYNLDLYKQQFKRVDRKNSIWYPISFIRFEQDIIERMTRTPINEIIEASKKVLKEKNDKIDILNQEFLAQKKMNYSRNQVAYLKNSENYYLLFVDTIEELRPILLYYSLVNFYSFFQRLFFNFKDIKKGHGIKILGIPENFSEPDFSKIQIQLLSFGFFSRLVKSLTFLGFPSIFSDYFIDIDESGNYCFIENTSPYRISNNPKLSIKTISEKDFILYFDGELDKSLEQLKEKLNVLPVDKTNKVHFYRDTSSHLIRFLSLFACSSLSRYYPYIWQEAIKSEKTELFLLMKSIYSSYQYDLRIVSEIIEIFHTMVYQDIDEPLQYR